MTSDEPIRHIRKKYTAPDGTLAIHVPATSTPEQIQRAYDLIDEIHELERGAIDRGIFEKPATWTGDAQTRLDSWVTNLTNGEAEQVGEFMSDEIEKFIAGLGGWRDIVREKLGGETPKPR